MDALSSTTHGRNLGGPVGMMLGSAASAQTGAAIGAHAFPMIGPAGVVAVRQLVSACILLPVVRPAVHRWGRGQWLPVLALGLVYSTMNLTLYFAIERVGLALAITLEFLGPLAVALAGARGRRDAVLAVAAAVGVYVLILPGGSTADWLGVGAALVAATCWSCYILLNRSVGNRLPGLEGPAVAAGVAAIAYLPVIVILVAQGRMTPVALGLGALVGLLSSVIPYSLDVVVLRRVSARLFAIVQSSHPVLAALAGMLILAQMPAPHVWVGIAVITAVNVLAILTTQTGSSARVRVAAEVELAGLSS